MITTPKDELVGCHHLCSGGRSWYRLHLRKPRPVAKEAHHGGTPTPRLLPDAEGQELLRRHWKIPDRQRDTSVALARVAGWTDRQVGEDRPRPCRNWHQ